MRHLSFAVLACAVLTVAAIRAADEPKDNGRTNDSDRAQVTKFFKEHVIGKTLGTPKTKFKMDDNKMEGDYEDQQIYNNFTETAEGFAFDVTSVSKQTLYDLDKEGKRIQPGRDFSGTFLSRYEICERASTKKLTGINRPLSTTIKAPSPEGTVTIVTGMKVADGKLTWNESVPAYIDFPGIKGKYKPGSYDVKMTISIVEGKLQIEGDQTNFDVDPDTLKRTPAKEKLPIFVTKEIDRK